MSMGCEKTIKVANTHLIAYIRHRRFTGYKYTHICTLYTLKDPQAAQMNSNLYSKCRECVHFTPYHFNSNWIKLHTGSLCYGARTYERHERADDKNQYIW